MNTIQIIGGGLTGLSLGVALRKFGVPVELHEASHYPRHKVCGEFINGVQPSTLEFLGILESFESAHRHTQVNWFYRNKAFYEFNLSSPALAISRFKLDKSLADTFLRMGGHLHTDSRITPSENEGTVVANGRKLNKESNWIGLKAHFSNLQVSSELEMHIGKSGYIGLCQVENGNVNACGLFKLSDASKGSTGSQFLFDYLKWNGLSHLRDRLESATLLPESFKGVTAFSLGSKAHQDSRLVVGDHHTIIPPFTGNGMSMAFESAEIACSPLIEYAKGEATWTETVDLIRSRMTKKFRTRMMVSGFIHPMFFSTIGQQALYRMGSLNLIPIQTLSRLLK